jgi:hypothetical protein
MSHDGSWRAACGMTIWILWFHIEKDSEARGVTDPGVGCTDWLGRLSHFKPETIPSVMDVKTSARRRFPYRVGPMLRTLHAEH